MGVKCVLLCPDQYVCRARCIFFGDLVTQMSGGEWLFVGLGRLDFLGFGLEDRLSESLTARVGELSDDVCMAMA